MKKQLLLPFFLVFSLLAMGQARQFTISGIIRDAAGNQPVPGVTVYLPDLKTGTISHDDGSYQVPALKPGRYLVEVSSEGYRTISEWIVLTANQTKDFSLTQQITEREAVVVTGTAGGMRNRQVPQPISIVSKTQLLQTPSTNVINALAARVPGVSALATGPAISKPFIRGLGYNRVVVVSDNIRQEGQQWGDEHGIEVDQFAVQKAEVLKGPASLIYGSDAIGGVVHLIQDIPVPVNTIRANVSSGYTDNSRMRDVNANIAGHLQNGFNWNAYGTYRKAGDYENQYDGRVFNSRFNEKNFGGYIGLNKSWGYSHLIVSHVNQYIGMVEGERDSLTGKFLSGAGGTEHIATDAELKSTAMETPYQNIQHLKIVSDNNFAVGKGRIQATVGFQRNQRKEFGNPEAITTPDLYFDLKTVNYTLQYHLPESGGWRTTVGFGGMTQTNRNKAEETLIPEYTLTDYGLFAVTNKTFRKFTLSGGIRGDLRRINSKQGMDEAGDVKFTPFNKSFSNISGSIGAAYDLSDAVTLKANIARGFRAPAMAELSSNGAHEGTLRYELGQQDLKSETSLQGDLGIDVNTSHVSFGVSAFYNHISNYIYYSKLAAADGSDSTRTDDEGNTLTAFKFSQHSANLYGLEATLDIHPHPLDWLHFENSFSYVRGRFVNAIEGDRDIPFIPAGNLRSELRADIRKAGFLRNGYIKVENQLTLQQNKVYTPFSTETITPSYNLLNAGIGTDIVTTGGYKLFSIYLAMNNITDKAYQNHLSRLKYLDANNLTGRNGVFNMGRNFSIRLNVPLNFRLK